MLIGIDGNEANLENRVGVNQYAYELLRNLHARAELWKGRHKFLVYLRDKPQGDMPTEKEGWEYKVLPGSVLWIITRLMPHLFLTRRKPDIFFTPSHYVPPFAPMPRVSSIMDLGYLEFSGQFKRRDYWQLRLWSAWSILVSKAVIAISNTTKKDILDHYKFAKNKITVTHLGYNKEKFNARDSKLKIRRARRKYKIKGDYLLFLGTLKPSKNIEGLLGAFAALTDYPRLTLVIAGKKGWLYKSIFEKVKRLGLAGRVIFTGFVPEDDKAGLIAGTKAFVLPSFWEGFGLDVLSAMALGVPVIVSNRGSLPEIIGNTGIIVDPENDAEIAQGIKKVIGMDKKSYNEMARAGKKHVEQFSWDKTAQKTMEVLEKAHVQR